MRRWFEAAVAISCLNDSSEETGFKVLRAVHMDSPPITTTKSFPGLGLQSPAASGPFTVFGQPLRMVENSTTFEHGSTVWDSSKVWHASYTYVRVRVWVWGSSKVCHACYTYVRVRIRGRCISIMPEFRPTTPVGG